MKLKRLEVQSLPGIEPGFVLDTLSPDSNLVTGPNAVGKSSLIRALRFLVGGTRNEDPPALSLKGGGDRADPSTESHWRSPVSFR